VVPVWVSLISLLVGVSGAVYGGVKLWTDRRDALRKQQNDDVEQLRESRDGWRSDSEALRERLSVAEARVTVLEQKNIEVTRTMQKNDDECRRELAKRDGQIAVMALQITELGKRLAQACPPLPASPPVPRLNDWRIDMLLFIAVVGLLVTCFFVRRIHQDRKETPKGKLTRFERISVTLQHRGDVFRLVQAVAGFVLMGAIVFLPGNHINWLLICLGVILAIIPTHTAILMLAQRKALGTVPGSGVERKQR
jgi:hypothetical protein